MTNTTREYKAPEEQPETIHKGPTAPVKFRYRNHEGKVRIREAIIRRIWFGSTKWHPEPQWFMRGLCIEHNANRDFALKDCNFSYDTLSMPDRLGHRQDGQGNY